MSFNFYSPTEIFFGSGIFSKTSKITHSLGKYPMIVCGRNAMKKYNYLKILEKQFKRDGKKIYVYNNISPDAKSNEVNEAISILKKKKIDFVIGLGGGSAIDAAKAIAVGNNFSKINNLIGKTITVKGKYLPIVAIPTTSGTGSEVTKGAIITDIDKNFKSGIRGNFLFPKVAIVDPMFSLTLPKEVLAETGFDAFTHLFESYCAKKANKITENFSELGLSILIKNLPLSLKNSKNLKAKEYVSYAALLGGINVANVSTCLPHRLQQAMGSVKEVSHPHARGLACVYPAWLKEEYKFSKSKIDKIKKKMNIRSEKYNFIIDFMDKIKVNNRLSDFGVRSSHIGTFIKNISGNLDNDPIANISNKLIKEVYLKSL